MMNNNCCCNSIKKALIIVDMQNDFCPGGSLAVKEGDKIVSVINQYIKQFKDEDEVIVFTRDWHPADHCSFKEYGGMWPSHCVAETKGAKFHQDIYVPEKSFIVSKADTASKDAYSGFEATLLDSQLKKLNIEEVWVCGLATDYCVASTVMDALKLGYKVKILSDAIAAVDVSAGDGEKAIAKMVSQGAEVYRLK
ncbi:MAG: bifunctional nicotinamidase/pyrazinamidase [Spirochaetaceae bacterium]|nr:bifunctional nicotinamidase/pyrazinamidase [Spirochaetaceae bacterium]